MPTTDPTAAYPSAPSSVVLAADAEVDAPAADAPAADAPAADASTAGANTAGTSASGEGTATPAGPPGPGAAAPAAPIALADLLAESAAADPTERPRATRVSEGALLGGVCTGLARHLGWPVTVIRIGFLALLIPSFLGVLVYGVLWLLLPPEQPSAAPGLEAADRSGMRQTAKPARRHDWGKVVALVVLGAGVLWIAQASGLGLRQQLFWPVAFACTGAALVWRQADRVEQKKWRAEAGGRVWLAPFVARGGWPALVRIILGLGLVGAAFGLVVAQQGQLQQLPEVLAMTLLALAGLAVVLAPWLHRSRNALNEARAEKVRADARADMAAHLHDSVLQTLALIQRQAEDPKSVQQLARRQERELRTWLYGEEAAEATLKAALTAAAGEVEDERGIPVEVVVVGDCETNEAVQALVRAAREAMVNAAKHSGADKIDVYVEVFDGTAEVFVRDRGQGFDLEAIAEDRMGVKGSIIDRMARHGGKAVIRSAPGEGTEVRLEMTT